MTGPTGASVTTTSYNNFASQSPAGLIYDFFWGIAGAAGSTADSATSALNLFNGGGIVIASFLPGAAAAPAAFHPRPGGRVVTVPFFSGRAGAQHSR